MYKNPAWFSPEDIKVNQEHIQAMPRQMKTWGVPVWTIRDQDHTSPPTAWQRFLLRWFL